MVSVVIALIDGETRKFFVYQITLFLTSLQTKCSGRGNIRPCLLTSPCTGHLSKGFFSKAVGGELLHIALYSVTIPYPRWRITQALLRPPSLPYSLLEERYFLTFCIGFLSVSF